MKILNQEVSKTTLVAISKIIVAIIIVAAMSFTDLSAEKALIIAVSANTILDTLGFKLSKDQESKIKSNENY